MNWKEKYLNKVTCRDCLGVMKELPDNSIDCIVTDPPYGYSFMSKDWDSFNEVVNPQGAYADKKGFKKLPRNKAGAGFNEFFAPIWKECLRILKPGAFAFIMSAPKQDTLSKQIVALQEAGFQTGFTSIYWTYASGFPKASNIGKLIDKQECRKQLIKKLGRQPTKEEFKKEWDGFREVIGKRNIGYKDKERSVLQEKDGWNKNSMKSEFNETKGNSELEGSYGGFQPKPAVEIILVVMKSLSEKTYVDQAIKNKKGITWFDDGRIPFSKSDIEEYIPHRIGYKNGMNHQSKKAEKHDSSVNSFGSTGFISQSFDKKGRFPANLLVENDILDDGKNYNKGGDIPNPVPTNNKVYGKMGDRIPFNAYNDSGSFSRYFSLDAWFKKKLKDLFPAVQKVFPFLIVPKASKGEKNEGVTTEKEKNKRPIGVAYNKDSSVHEEKKKGNIHPTCKPIKLMSYLITIGSREKDIILDPFAGSCTTGVSAIMLNRQYIMCEKEKEYFEIGKARLDYVMSQLKLF